jgi:hypothetical protein
MEVATYLNLKQASSNVDIVSIYIEQTVKLCRTTINVGNRKLTSLKEMRSLVLQLTRNERVVHRTFQFHRTDVVFSFRDIRLRQLRVLQQ